jgi:hypothetical protein
MTVSAEARGVTSRSTVTGAGVYAFELTMLVE